MVILHIQHSVPTFDAWKRAFDSDPLNRRESGVRQYHVRRSVEDPTFVVIELEFDTVADAETMRRKLQGLWAGPGGAVTRNPEAWVLETVETSLLR